MSRLRNTFLTALLCLAIPGSAYAQAQKLDDSASQVLGGVVRMQWLDPAPSAHGSNLMAGQVTVLVSLDVAAWRGRNARIYQALGKQATPVRAEWTARGPLMPGGLSDGDRALVYSGPILEDRLSDTFVITLIADGNLLERPETLDFSFEIELEGQ